LVVVVHMIQVFIQVLLVEGSRQDALDEALSLLELMGESFPKSGISVVVDRKLEKLRSSDRQKDNTVLLRPQRVTDKKTLDVFVSNMLGESEKPLLFFGDKLEDETKRLSTCSFYWPMFSKLVVSLANDHSKSLQ
jgi:hypothetical protein